MAALASLLRSRHRGGSHAADALLLRALSTAAAASSEPAALTLTPSSFKARLRREIDPDRVVSIFEAIDDASLSASSTRHALSLAARRLSRARRYADAEALLSSRLPASPTEPQLAAVLCAYASASLPEKAVAAFRSAAPSLPSPISPLPFNALLSVFLRCRRHRRVPVLFEELSKEFSIKPDATSYGILVKAYCMLGKDAKAHEVLDKMRGQGFTPTTNIYTTMIDSMYKQKKIEAAERLWKKMLESGRKPDQALYNAKVFHYSLHGKTEDVFEVIAEMEAAGVKPDTITYNFLMTSYCKDGKIDSAKEMYRSLAEKGCSANAATYKHMLAHLCAHGDLDGALQIFKESFRSNKVPDFRTMRGLVEGLTNVGRTAEAKSIVTKMKKMFPEQLLSGWAKLEKELGLNSDGGDAGSQAECIPEETPAEAETSTAKALELEDPSDDETGCMAEASIDEEVTQGTA
uniref:Pentacotripeptide-repeat region of PRORP domain-containing protein n=1 Tax=Leersia perrieri TaxID=77586 RepID=A0A0D9VIM9_9ORYZ